MNIWLLEIGEILPLNTTARKMRAGLLAEKLIERGHEVRWWTSTFEHQSKKDLFLDDTILYIKKGLILHALKGYSYKSNVSIKRYLHHRIIATKFRAIAHNISPPNLIIAFFPCHLLAYEGVLFAIKNKIPIIVDIEDKWPDIIIDLWNGSYLYRIIKFILKKDLKNAKYTLKKANAIIAVSNSYLKWGLNKIERYVTEWDRVFYLGYTKGSEKLHCEDQNKYFPLWLKSKEYKKLFIFIGTFGVTYDLEIIIDVARKMHNDSCDEVCFVLAGTGEQFEKIKKESYLLPNVLLSGWIDSKDIQFLLKMAYAGLLVYKKNAPQSLSNKFFEYLTGGLPIINSLEGEVAEIIKHYNIGLNYKAGDATELYNCIKTLLRDSVMHKKMSLNAIAFFNEYCDANKIYTEYARHIEKLVESKSMM